MKDYPLEKYTFYTATKTDGTPYKVIAVTTFAGKKVRGVATCSPNDTFNLDLGKEIAAAKANLKVAERRKKLSAQRFKEAYLMQMNVDIYCHDMLGYKTDSETAYIEAIEKLNDIIKRTSESH